jgi:hypothetical protein
VGRARILLTRPSRFRQSERVGLGHSDAADVRPPGPQYFQGAPQGERMPRRKLFADAVRTARRCAPLAPARGEVVGDVEADIIAIVRRDREAPPPFLRRQIAEAISSTAASARIGEARRVELLSKRADLQEVLLRHLLAVEGFAPRPWRSLRTVHVHLRRARSAEAAHVYRQRRNGAEVPFFERAAQLQLWRMAERAHSDDENAERYGLRGAPRLLSDREARRLWRDLTVNELAALGASAGMIANLFQRLPRLRARVSREQAKKIAKRFGASPNGRFVRPVVSV